MRNRITFITYIVILLILLPVLSLAGGKRVLGVSAGMAPQFKTMLESEGFTFSGIDSSDPITSSMLAEHDILWFHDCRYDNDVLSPVEKNAITQFLTAGGSLLVDGEVDHYGPQNVTNHGSIVGVTCSTSGYSTSVTQLSSHPVFNGINSVRVFGGVALSTSSPAQPIAWYNDGKPYAAAGVVGEGRFIVFGDEVWLSHDQGNAALVDNVFNWLAPVPEPSSIVALLCGIGGMGSIILKRKTS